MRVGILYVTPLWNKTVAFMDRFGFSGEGGRVVVLPGVEDDIGCPSKREERECGRELDQMHSKLTGSTKHPQKNCRQPTTKDSSKIISSHKGSNH